MRFAFKNLFRRRIRTALSVLGVAVGVGSIVAFTAMGEGFKKSVDEYATQTGAHLIAIEQKFGDPAFGRIKKEEFDEIARHPNVADVGGSSALPAKIEGRSAPLLVIGRDPAERPIRTYRNPALRGRLLFAPEELMMGEILAEELGTKPGDTFEVLNRTFTVVGIYSTGVRWENGGVIIHARVFREEHKMEPGSAMAAFIYLDDPERSIETAAALYLTLPKLRILPTSMISQNFEQFAYIDAFIWVISLAALIVGAIGILNTMLMSISERTREIGTLRAFGWTRGMVLRLIMQEGLLTSVLGGVAGFAVGVAGAEFLMRLVPQGVLVAHYDLSIFVRGMIVAVVLGFVGALYPAWRASRLAPAEALRYE